MYLTNKEFSKVLKKHPLKKGKKSHKSVARCYNLIINRLLKKNSFRIYSDSWKEEMKSEAIKDCIMYGHNANASGNLFSYFTTIILNAFYRAIKRERKQLYIKFRGILDASIDSPQILDEDDFIGTLEENALKHNLEEIRNEVPYEIDADYMMNFIYKYENSLNKSLTLY